MASTAEANSTPPANVAVDAGTDAVDPPPPTKSLITRFLEVRGLEVKAKTPAPITSPLSPAAKTSQLAPRPVWHRYNKAKHGERIDFYRRAIAIPDEAYTDSVDLYNPKKRPTRLIDIHREAPEVNQDFMYQTRCLTFERQVLDRPVKELLDNRQEYDDSLDHIYCQSDY